MHIWLIEQKAFIKRYAADYALNEWKKECKIAGELMDWRLLNWFNSHGLCKMCLCTFSNRIYDLLNSKDEQRRCKIDNGKRCLRNWLAFRLKFQRRMPMMSSCMPQCALFKQSVCITHKFNENLIQMKKRNNAPNHLAWSIIWISNRMTLFVAYCHFTSISNC